jgi:FG-GAP repeat
MSSTTRRIPSPLCRTGGSGARKVRAPALALIFAVALLVTMPATPVAAARIATAYDFNGDGRADLAVGVPGEAVGSVARAGAVQVINGSRTGLTATRSQTWNQASPGIQGVPRVDDSFGESNTSGDFDADGYADLAIGVPGGAFGAVAVLYGSRHGLTARDQLFHSSELGHQDVWGGSLAAGDFNGDGRADLAIGADPAFPSSHGQGGQKGALTVLRGSNEGLSRNGAVRFTKDSAGIAGTSEIGDAFGAHLAAGDVTGDGRDDLAVASRKRLGQGGEVHFLAGSAQGVTATGSGFYTTETPGLTPADTTFSALGSDVALGDFDGDGHDDLAIGDDDAGPPGSTDCATRAACPGAVLVLPGSASGPVVEAKQLWYQDARGVPGSSEGGDIFGGSLTTGDLNGDGRADLAVGSPGEDIGSPAVFDCGAVNLIYGSPTGLSGVGAQMWSQRAADIKGAAEDSDYFGRGVRIANFGGGAAADLAVYSEGEDVGAATEAAAVNVLYGSTHRVTARDQFWSQNSPGVAGRAQSSDFFGAMSRVH